MKNVIIIGSGPAAHTAAIYTGRAQLNPLLFEGEMAGGVAPGGQLTTTTEVENYPGFKSINGTDLMYRMREQSEACGTTIETKTVIKIDLSKKPFKVYTSETEYYETKSIIIATGATAKRLRLPGEDIYWQKGISACAVCDGALPFFRNKPMIVVGGGDTAVEEATYLTKYASHVTMLVRRDVLRASKTMQNRALNNPKISIAWNSIPLEATGEKLLQKVKIQNTLTKEESELAANGLFKYRLSRKPIRP